MSEVSTFRLYLLRGMYVFMVVGLAIFKLAPAILHPENLSPQDGVIVSLLGEFVWKVIWVVALGLPLLLSGGLDPNVSFGGTETLINCLLGIVLVPIVVPWGYVFKHYLKAPGARWGKQQVSSAIASESTDPDDGVSTGVDEPAVTPSKG